MNGTRGKLAEGPRWRGELEGGKREAGKETEVGFRV